jgi:integrase
LPPRRSPYWVAQNLYINKSRPPGVWVLMYSSPVKGRRVEMGLGPARDPALAGAAARANGLSLAEAKGKALELRATILRGRCPLSERQAEQEARKAGHSRARGSHTFQDVAEIYITAHRVGWSSAKHARQWEESLANHVYPMIGNLPVNRIDDEAVLAILDPIWRDKPVTASRVRGRVESVFDYAKARKWFSGENPARWRGHLENLLPKASKVRPVTHQPAMPWPQVPAFYQSLCRSRGISALALRYTILNALRTTEALLATVDEIDRDQRLHILPAKRTKPRVELRAPLSDEALRILDQAEERRTSAFVFSGRRVGKPLSDAAMLEQLRAMAPGLTTHGFRSTFRDWAAEAEVPREIAEMCLGHSLGAVEGAYWRSDVLQRRRAVMDAWAAFLVAPVAEAEVVALSEEAERRAG